MNPPLVILTGAAGFIGSHLADALLARGTGVIGVDNLSRGTRANLKTALAHPRFRLIEADLSDPRTVEQLTAPGALPSPVDAVWHLAANSDIPAGIADAEIDLKHTFLTTHYSLAIARKLKIPKFVLASSSAVYGEHPAQLREDTGPLFPISNYGAMKLASEGALSAALESDLDCAWIFRFPNVVGNRATHGVIYDLIGKLKRDRSSLEVLGDGTQEKPYLHVSDLLAAMLLAFDRGGDDMCCYNIAATGDDVTTVRYIAERVIARVAKGTPIRWTGGSRGWVGDVPKFTYSTEKIASIGWRPRLRSREAVDRAVDEIATELGE